MMRRAVVDAIDDGDDASSARNSRAAGGDQRADTGKGAAAWGQRVD